MKEEKISKKLQSKLDWIYDKMRTFRSMSIHVNLTDGDIKELSPYFKIEKEHFGYYKFTRKDLFVTVTRTRGT